MTSKNQEEIFQLIKDDIPKEKTKLRKLIPPRLQLAANNWLLISKGVMKELCLWVLFFLINYEQFSIYFFLPFRLLHFFFSNHLSDFYSPQKLLIKKQITWFKLISLN